METGLQKHQRSESVIFFVNLQLWPLKILQPLDQKKCLVPHLKDLKYICLEYKAKGHCMTFKVFNVGSKYPKITTKNAN